MANWLVVGLGNPGPTYAAHRHNVGYLVVDELARRAGVRFSRALTLRADVASSRIGETGLGAVGDGTPVVMMKSRTFMNNTGQAVAKVAKYYRTQPANLVVIHDELDLEFGQLRVKFGGGDNGHNGLKSIRAHLATGDFFRARLGIGRPPGRQEPAQFVLTPFPRAELDGLAEAVGRTADAVECLLASGLESAQNRYNS